MNLISIIIPIYNVEKYLRECLDSIVKQTYTNLEIICVVDGSPDNCNKICEEYAMRDSRIIVIHKENGGVSSARNAGLDAATGDWMYFIDADDWIERNTLELALKKAIETNADMCIFDYDQVYQNKRITVPAIKNNEGYFADMDNYETLCIYLQSLIMCNCLVKMSPDVRKIRYDDKMNDNEDGLFKFQLYGQIRSFFYMPKALYNYRMRATSATARIKDDYPQMLYRKYDQMMDALKKGNYPDKAQIAINSMHIYGLGKIVRLAFQDKPAYKCDYKVIQNYMNTNIYKNAILNYDKRFMNSSGVMKIYIKLKKPNRLIFSVVQFLAKIKPSNNKELIKFS